MSFKKASLVTIMARSIVSFRVALKDDAFVQKLYREKGDARLMQRKLAILSTRILHLYAGLPVPLSPFFGRNSSRFGWPY